MKKLFLIAASLFLFMSSAQKSFGQCNPATFQGVFNITQTTAQPTINSTGPTNYVEYGLTGFTPGTGATAGVGGTLVLIPTTQNFVTITGLTPYTSYQIYTRKNCSGTWSANSSAYAFGTAYNCNNSSAINCSQLVTLNIPSGPGAWVSIGGKEVIYKFTPPIYGNHTLYLPATTSATQTAEYYFKSSSSGCTESGFTFIGSSHPSVTQSFSFGPLNAGTEYYIMVNAFSQTGVSSQFRIDCPTSGCGTPTGFSSTNVGTTSATINWQAVVNATSYDIQYRINGSATWINTASSSATKNLTGLTPGSIYEWRVSAYCTNGGGASSAWTASQFFTTTASACSIPSNLSVSSVLFPPDVTFSWDAVPGAISYDVRYGPGGNFGPPVNVTTNSYLANLQFDNYTFQWQVRSICGPGDTSAYSPLVTFTTPQFCTPPSALYVSSANITTTSALLEWSALTCNGNYTLRYRVNGTATWSYINNIIIVCPALKNYSLTGLLPATSYEWEIGLNCVSGPPVQWPGTTWVFTTLACAPATITGSTTFCAGSAITLTANTGTGITYQWYKNSVAQSGATSSTYLIGSAGTYYVVETSSCGTATSNSLVVTQINNPNPTMSYTTPTTFCSPGTITFTANTFAGVTYQWQKNSIDIAGATNQTYTATTNGKYRVKQTANGCTKQGQDVQVTTATSVASVIAANGPTSFCTGGSVVLSVSNAIPGYSYQWKNNNVNISGATLSNYTATTAGSYTCYVSANCGNATSNAIAVSTGGIVALVNPSGTVNICTGATVALSANTGTGYAFQWKKNGTNITGATASTYNATTAGAYTVAITSPCGNATSVATTVVITALTATASPSSTTICNGSAATFTANTGYNFTYQWYRAGIAIAGATNSTHANSTAGNYTVVITQGGVCSATSNIASLTVISNPNPTVTLSGPTTFCAGQSVTITANTFAGVTYQWIKGSTNIAGATNQSYTATTAGQYNVKETASGCTKQMGVPVVVTVNCREEANELAVGSTQLTVVPNPFTNEFEVNGLKFEIGDRIEMMDVLGKVVLSRAINTATENCKLQTVNFPSGIYFLKVTTSTEQKTVKVVKQ